MRELREFNREHYCINRTTSAPGRRSFRSGAHLEKLLAAKRGGIAWPEVDAWRKELHRDFEHALAETKLPERPDYEAANRFPAKAGVKWHIECRQRVKIAIECSS